MAKAVILLLLINHQQVVIPTTIIQINLFAKKTKITQMTLKYQKIEIMEDHLIKLVIHKILLGVLHLLLLGTIKVAIRIINQ